MATLTALLHSLAALLVACGISAQNATMAALAFLFLLVTALIAAFLVQVLLRRRRQERDRATVEPPTKDDA